MPGRWMLRVLLPVVFPVLATSCAGKDGGPEGPPLFVGTDLPMLENLGVEVAAYDPVSGLAGDVRFVPEEARCFVEYGGIVTDGMGIPKNVYEWDFHVNVDAVVVAAADGQISGVEFSPTANDYSVHIKPGSESSWIVVHDHLNEIVVTVGQIVQAGDPLGKPGNWSPGVGRTELGLYNTSTRETPAPFAYFDVTRREEYESKVWQLLTDWESFQANPSVYDQAAMDPYFAGCLTDTHFIP